MKLIDVLNKIDKIREISKYDFQKKHFFISSA